jgi:endoglucanase Acf2
MSPDRAASSEAVYAWNGLALWAMLIGDETMLEQATGSKRAAHYWPAP